MYSFTKKKMICTIQISMSEMISYGNMAIPKFEEFVHGFIVTLYKEKTKSDDVVITNLYNLIQGNQPIRLNVMEIVFAAKKIPKRWINKLKDEGQLAFVGSKKTAKYVVRGVSAK